MYKRQELTWDRLKNIMVRSTISAATIMLIIAVASAFGKMLTIGQLPATMVNFILSHDVSKGMFLLIVMVMLLIAGTFMDQISTVLILTPMLLLSLIHILFSATRSEKRVPMASTRSASFTARLVVRQPCIPSRPRFSGSP